MRHTFLQFNDVHRRTTQCLSISEPVKRCVNKTSKRKNLVSDADGVEHSLGGDVPADVLARLVDGEAGTKSPATIKLAAVVHAVRILIGGLEVLRLEMAMSHGAIVAAAIAGATRRANTERAVDIRGNTTRAASSLVRGEGGDYAAATRDQMVVGIEAAGEDIRLRSGRGTSSDLHRDRDRDGKRRRQAALSTGVQSNLEQRTGC